MSKSQTSIYFTCTLELLIKIKSILAGRLFQTLTTRSLKKVDLTRIEQLFLYSLNLWPRALLQEASFFSSLQLMAMRAAEFPHLCLSLASRTAHSSEQPQFHTTPLYHWTIFLLVFREVCRLQPSPTLLSLSICCHPFCRCGHWPKS